MVRDGDGLACAEALAERALPFHSWDGARVFSRLLPPKLGRGYAGGEPRRCGGTGH